MPEPVPDGFATAQVIGQSAVAAGAPQYAGGERGDLWHGRINSAAGLEVTVRLDVRLPGRPGPGLEVPALSGSSTYDLFHGTKPYQDVGRCGRPAAPPVSMAERFSKIHCGRCIKPLPEKKNRKALNKGGWFWVCHIACSGMGSTDEWKCPTAADGERGCKCCCEPKQAAPGGKRKAGGQGHTSSKEKKRAASRTDGH